MNRNDQTRQMLSLAVSKQKSPFGSKRNDDENREEKERKEKTEKERQEKAEKEHQEKIEKEEKEREEKKKKCHKLKVLFICRGKKFPYDDDYSKAQMKSTGLVNSAYYVSQMLNSNDVESKVVTVNDNNDIDREVHKYKPNVVIIEALWVIPQKFEVLTKLHPKVKWVIRLHSEIPFLANESVAIKWCYEYIKYNNVHISSNNRRATGDLSKILDTKVLYLPNYYPVDEVEELEIDKDCQTIDIGCFGAIRPLKNQLIQAVAAVVFGDNLNKSINFHINVSRIENKGEAVLENIEALFANNPQHKLIKHKWKDLDNFTDLVAKMDIGMQVSFSETFNIVAADFVAKRIPVVVSPQINWVNEANQADPNSVNDIVKKLMFVYHNNGHCKSNLNNLKKYGERSTDIWLHFLCVKEDSNLFDDFLEYILQFFC